MFSLKRLLPLAGVLCLLALPGCNLSGVVSAIQNTLPTIDQLASDAAYTETTVEAAIGQPHGATKVPIALTTTPTTRSVHAPADTIGLVRELTHHD